MKNITKQYQDLLEGKMSRDNFVRNARMQFPQFISPVTSIDDTIKILKSKRIIAEVEKEMDEHHNDPNFPGGPKIHAMLDAVAKDWGKDSELYNDLEDAIVGWSDMHGELTPKGKIAVKALLSNWDVLGDYENFLNDNTPEYKNDEDVPAFMRMYNSDAWVQAQKDMQGESISDDEDTRDLRVFDPKNRYTPESLINFLLQQGKDLKWVVSVVQQRFPDADIDALLDRVNAHKNAGSPTFNYNDDLPFYENKKKSIKEAEDLTLSQIVDRLNPYTLKHGIAKELEKVKNVDDASYAKALETAAKKLQKDPNAYKDVQFPNAKEVEKHDNNMQMVPVKDKNHVDEKNKMQTAKGQEKPKANTKASTKENKKGKPKGVKEMGVTPKKAPGITKVMDMPGKEKVLSDLKESLKKTLAEDTHHKYNIGTDVHTPEGPGKVTGVLGGTISVQLDNGEHVNYQINVLDAAEEKAYRDMQFSKMPNIGTSGQNWLSHHVSEQYNDPKKDEFKNLVDKYDWYHEMSDDDRKHQAALDMNKKLKALAKEIGEDEALKMFNAKAPKDRQIKSMSDLREDKKTKEDKYSKLKEYLKKVLKKEAVKFKAGGETIFKNNTEAGAYEADLKKAGVKYVKSSTN